MIKKWEGEFNEQFYYERFVDIDGPAAIKLHNEIKKFIAKTIDSNLEKSSSFEERLNEIFTEMKEILIKKQSDYGSQNIKETGEVGIIVRMNDKMARLKNLNGFNDNSYKPKTAKNESIDDAYMDIANYAILALLLRKNQL